MAGTAVDAFSFDAPLPSTARLNSALSGGSTITVSGLNFGAADFTDSAAAASAACATSMWSSSTSVACRTAHIGAYPGFIEVTVAAMVGTGRAPWSIDHGRDEIWSFDAPTLSVGWRNGPMTGGASLTVSGLNFGSGTATASVAYGHAHPCSTTGWTSVTTVACLASASRAMPRSFGMTVAGVVGTGFSIFSFDAPAASFSTANAVGTGRSSLTVTGLSFLAIDLTSTAQVLSNTCGTTSWTSTTAVTCLHSRGTSSWTSYYAEPLATLLTVVAVVGTAVNPVLFSFDAPAVSSVPHNAGAASGRASVTVGGLLFATLDATSTGFIASATCRTASWSSSSSVVCLASAVDTALVDASMVLTVSAVVSTGVALLSFDAPVGSHGLIAANTPPTGGASVTVSGLSFRHGDYTHSATLEWQLCSTTSWTSSTAVACASGVVQVLDGAVSAAWVLTGCNSGVGCL